MVTLPTDALRGSGDDPFALTPEQHHIVALLERLLGRAIANRYVDFSRLAFSGTGLSASRPMAAHALRELDSMIRGALVVPMEAKAAENEQDAIRLKEALELLKGKGYGEESLQRAEKALKPRHNHATEIKLIGARLGLSEDSDIIRAWISLTRTVGYAHERHFHRSMAVDDAFRSDFQTPLELVLGGILTALQKRYAAFMHRVEVIAAMPDRAKAIRLFETEIPSAMPLQWHFFQNIRSADWLPQLLKRGLVREPVLDEDDSDVREYGPWPVGHYLLNVAKSGDTDAIPHLVEALRAVEGSPHPAVKRTGFVVIATLPPAVANALVDVVIEWLEQDTPDFYYVAPSEIVKLLAEAGYVDSAIKIAGALFRVFDRGGEMASIHPPHMYEHHIPDAVNILASRDGLGTVRLLSAILLAAAGISNKVRSDDYSYMTPHPLSDSQMANYGIWEALLIAVRNAALLACQAKPAETAEVVGYLAGLPLKIFRRIALHVLSKNTVAAPHLAATILTDTELIGQGWCEDEYAELAMAHFPQLLPEQQQIILSFVDALPDRFRESWRENFLAHQKAEPTAEDERRYENAVLQEATWKWRSVLPPDRQRLLDDSIKLLGDPENWHHRLFPPEFSPLSTADFAVRPMQDILALLRNFAPSEEPVRHTINALGQQLRAAVAQEPARFAEVADAFADLRPIFVRRLLEGFETLVANKTSLQWR